MGNLSSMKSGLRYNLIPIHFMQRREGHQPSDLMKSELHFDYNVFKIFIPKQVFPRYFWSLFVVFENMNMISASDL